MQTASRNLRAQYFVQPPLRLGSSRRVRALPALPRGSFARVGVPGTHSCERRCQQQRLIARFKQGAGTELQLDQEYLHLDFDATELLDLHGRDSYLFCDITRAYDDMVSAPLIPGYSPEVLAGRQELLDFAKEKALYHEGQVQRNNKGIDVPVMLLPSVLAHFAQINQNNIVFDLGSKLLENWDMRKVYKRDLILSLAVANCNLARDLLADQKVADGCNMLEEALSLLTSAGQPPLAPGLAADIHAAVDGMVVQRILDQLRGPMTPEAAPARKRAVAMLRELLASGPAKRRAAGGLLPASLEGAAGGAAGLAADGAVTSDYARLVVDCMTSSELVGMANWEQVARNAGSTSWLYPGLLQIAATAHIAAGFTERRPATIRAGLAVLRTLPSSCEVLLLRGVGSLLVDEQEAAVQAIKAAARAPPDANISWPSDAPASAASDGEEAAASAWLPPGPDAFAFLQANSPGDDAELLSGLCLYTNIFLSKVVFAGFPDTAQLSGAPASLAAYFDSPGVQAQLLADRERSAGVVGSFSALMAAVMSVQPLVQRIAASASSTIAIAKARGIQLRRDAPPAAAAAAPAAVNRLALDIQGEAAGQAKEGSEAEAPQQQLQRVAGRLQTRGLAAATAASEATGGALAAAGQLLAGLQGRLGGRAPVGLAAVAALAAAAAVGLALVPRGRAGAPAPAPAPRAGQLLLAAPAASAAAAAGAASVQTLDKAGAAKLLKRYQQAKAAALGSGFDTSQLSAVCTGSALGNATAMSGDWAGRGWFRSSNVWKCDVTAVERLSSSGQRLAVRARLGETANTWGIDGQAGTSWSNEYDVEYEVVLCRDLQWRIAHVQVKGREPGMPEWFGARLFNNLFGNNKPAASK